MIHRFRKGKGGYTKVPNTTTQDAEISFRALGLLTHLLARPENWDVCLKEVTKRKGKREGRDAVEAAFAELVDAGYITKTRNRDPKTGRLGKVVYEIFPEPQKAAATNGFSGSGENSLSTEKTTTEPQTGFQEVGTALKNNGLSVIRESATTNGFSGSGENGLSVEKTTTDPHTENPVQYNTEELTHNIIPFQETLYQQSGPGNGLEEKNVYDLNLGRGGEPSDEDRRSIEAIFYGKRYPPQAVQNFLGFYRATNWTINGKPIRNIVALAKTWKHHETPKSNFGRNTHATTGGQSLAQAIAANILAASGMFDDT